MAETEEELLEMYLFSENDKENVDDIETGQEEKTADGDEIEQGTEKLNAIAGNSNKVIGVTGEEDVAADLHPEQGRMPGGSGLTPSGATADGVRLGKRRFEYRPGCGGGGRKD